MTATKGAVEPMLSLLTKVRAEGGGEEPGEGRRGERGS